MAPFRKLVPMLSGLGAGVALGYVVGIQKPAPLIKAFPSSPKVGELYTLYFEGFPANTELVSPRNTSIAGGDLVSLGTTGANGVLTISNVTAAGPAGTYYLVAFDTATGKYCALLTLVVTP